MQGLGPLAWVVNLALAALVLLSAVPIFALASHLEGIRYLREAGVGVRPVSSDAFQRDISMALRRQRETFLSSPVRGSLLLFWRAATKQVPFVGRLREQQIASRQLECLRGGQTQRAF